MEELEIVHPETGKVSGIVLPRHQALAEQAWCRSTNVFVLNTKGEILCHQRSQQKERMPGVWVTHLGGHVGKGETYETNALKELQEEAGIEIPASSLLAWRTTKIPVSRLWTREFVTLVDLGEHELIPQPGEVDQFAWLSVEHILNQSKSAPENWCAGTHDFRTEYQCLRSVLTAAQSVGSSVRIPEALLTWHPLPA